MIRETGDGIKRYLDRQFAAMEVEGFPDDPTAYVLKNPHGAILISYDGREWSDPRSGDPQHVREIRYNLTLVKRNLQAKGAYLGSEEALDEVSEAMIKFETEGFTFYPTRDAFVSEVDGVWFYALTVTGYHDARLRL